MGHVTLNDIRLQKYTLDSLPLLKELKAGLLRTKPKVCIERARYITEFLRDKSSESDSIQTRYARATAHFLSNKQALFFDNNMLAGTTTSKPFGAPVYPEQTGMTIWPELETISTRQANPLILSKEDARTLNLDVNPYWMDRNIIEYTRKKHGNPDCLRLFERLVFYVASKAGAISHTVPFYEKALKKGLEGIIEEARQKEHQWANAPQNHETKRSLEFYEAVQICMHGIITYATHLSQTARDLARAETEPWRKNNLEAMADVCAHVPAKPARTFREAMNALWIIQVAIHTENINMAMSPGRLDQILYPYFRKDQDQGILSTQEAMEIVGCLWLKLNDNTNLVPETAEELFGGAGTVPAVTVGGVDNQGEDAVNDLTYIMLRVTELLKTRDPSLNARYHYEKNSEEYRNRLAEVIENTRAVPAMYNDVAVEETLLAQGCTPKHARDYAVIGCVELASAGRSYDASSSIILNLVSALELALYNGTRPMTGNEQISPPTGNPAEFKSMKEFWDAFKSQLSWVIDNAIELNELYGKTYQERMPSPLLSAFFEGPMESGKDLIFGGAIYNSSGATHVGFADTVDSLNAIEKAVFVDKKCTMDQLIQAVKDNFNGHESLHAYLVNKAPKYGTEDTIAVKNSHTLIKFLFDLYQSRINYRGGPYKPAYWTMTNHAGQGKMAGALPNGRKANKVFASGITPASQAAADLASCFKAVGELDHCCIPGGVALNLKYPAIESEEDRKYFAAAVEAYFRYGGLHVQFNIMSYQDLLDAKQAPEKYPELLVRVSGYSAYFKDLNQAMMEEIITRTAYNLRTGKAVDFPEEHKDMLAYE